MRKPVSARVTGFDYTTHHAYRTEVAADGHHWSLAIRYNTFFQFYTKLLEIEPRFKAPFPPKGGLFFAPTPEERQVQLDDFLQNTITFYELRNRPDTMGALLDDLLQVSANIEATESEAAASEPEPVVAEATKPVQAKESRQSLSKSWVKAVSAALQAVVVNTFQEDVEVSKPTKAVESEPEITASSPTSRASFSKTPRASATVTPLEMATPPSDGKAEREPLKIEVASGVRERIAAWEQKTSPLTTPTQSLVRRRSSTASSSFSDQAPVMPVSVDANDVIVMAVAVPQPVQVEAVEVELEEKRPSGIESAVETEKVVATAAPVEMEDDEEDDEEEVDVDEALEALERRDRLEEKLRFYRHPIFFQQFSCVTRTSFMLAPTVDAIRV